ncbi:IucA/IucC family C-terminal-domain containing protein [Salimicrobium halophilum]|uniref:Ferric iron reductase protein FhuF, involved in iron transport n=1 Tax=Salimicrobium halophilum TaxID=86666 RepID=A0A1G8T8Q1_9BACI|nr:IucA/IucC family C-terminal-domain containing protein [Salimicrobium halophilum]SDJ37956.1 Ferric iron reductase protein FhuF, involved in iron transport [Salimicrobium halophilum]
MNAMPELVKEPQEFLAFQQERLCAPNRKVAASMIMKRYAKVYLDEVMESLLFGKKKRVIPLCACSFTDELNLIVDETQVSYKNGDAWGHIFAEHLSVFVTSLHQATRLPHIILWENVAVRMNSYLRKAVQKHADQAFIVQNFAEELRNLNGTSFGADKNPLSSYLAPREALSEQCMRKTCCYYHKLDKEKEMDYCIVCPLQ